MGLSNRSDAGPQRIGGFCALYLAAAYVAAMPYFLLIVDYQGATTAADKVALILGHQASMYAMYLVTYVVFGLALAVLSLALHERLRSADQFGATVATAVGLLWASALVASGLVFNYGMSTVQMLARSDFAAAVAAWQAMEPIAQGLGGAGGELLGGLWVLLVCSIGLRGGVLPKALGWLGVVIGVAGLASVAPPLHEMAYAFGLLQIVWFAWLGIAMVGTSSSPVDSSATSPALPNRAVVS